MDLLVLITVAVALIVVILTILYLQKNKGDEKKENVAARPRPQQAQPGIPRRAQIARNQRNRLARANVDQVPEQAAAADSDDDGDEPEIMKADIAGEKMGAKKRAKLEAKAEKKSQREAEMKLREEKKKKEAMQEDERKKEEEKERLEELKREEAARKEKEEQERREHEEYLKMKAAFVVEEEGFEEGDEDEKANLLQEFIKYIQENKVVILEDLATHFKLKTQVAIDRIHDLQRNGTLTGVIDDRGKYICISEDELSAIAKFIKQRGRISLSELAENSNSLINFAQPVV